ncbi:MAG: flagellar biosynthesis protein FlhB [Candidatus Kapabacteria bacterium]|nr:flagellar biosynthesis protein FlhB [Ignavibacteriota bacterium]MCW5886182.1 flagellar biosynthesis protein FlhB [Candidatus Kapabacteria bacterium]
MAENQDGQEKTEKATTKRLTEGKDKGQVSKSMDITTATILLIGGTGVFLSVGPFVSSYQAFSREIFGNLANVNLNINTIPSVFNNVMFFMASVMIPIMGLVVFLALSAEISQVGFHVAKKKFTEGLNFKKIFNPFPGLKRIFFSKHTMVELVKNFAKVIVLGLVVWSSLASKGPLLVGLLERPFSDVGTSMGALALEVLLKMGAVYIFIAAADFFYQKWKFAEDMKMTKTEVKEEGKQSEGDPKVKAKIRGLMLSRIRKIMLSNVKTADVVITNPTHYAVALAYKQGQMNAPVVVAKGVDFLALKIREIAQLNNVPIVEEPPLARALYSSVKIDQEIPENLFKSVAQVLAYIYALQKKIYPYHKRA